MAAPASSVPPPVGLNDRLRRYDAAYILSVSSSKHGDVLCRVPERYTIESTSEWDYALGPSPGGLLNVVLQDAFGISRRTTYTTAQVWTGNTPIELSFRLEFRAYTSSMEDVVKPIKRLLRMQLPKRVGGIGLLAPPGPRIFNKSQASHDYIIINVGNFLTFDQVVVIDVVPDVEGLFMIDGLPTAASVDVRFRTLAAICAEDVDLIFGAGGFGNPVGIADGANPPR